MVGLVTGCRACGGRLSVTMADLGLQPPSNAFLSSMSEAGDEKRYPLRAKVCESCKLVQLDYDVAPEELFRNYVYFSSYSDQWLAHAKQYCHMALSRFALGPQSLVVELASNDGYLLKNFVELGIPVLGIDPSDTVAAAAEIIGVPTLVEFFGETLARALAREGRSADLIIGNNVLAQVPDLNDFVAGLRVILKPDGVLTLEFPHLLRLIERNEFDTIYHEHFSYFSLLTTLRILEAHGLKVFHVEELSTHGGSLRVYACRAESPRHEIRPSVGDVIAEETRAGMASADGYAHFAQKVKETKLALVEFLIGAARLGKSVAGYGAPGKSATLLHYCGIGKDLIQFTVDRSPYKQGRFLPGSHIPIHHPDRIREAKPDYVIILPWNLKDEIMTQLEFIRDWGGKFVIPIPQVTIV